EKQSSVGRWRCRWLVDVGRWRPSPPSSKPPPPSSRRTTAPPSTGSSEKMTGNERSSVAFSILARAPCSWNPIPPNSHQPHA
ncbi:hypothetical protein EE612_057619, partial [Oryza sativa]